jgi:hypothetical protein
VNVSNSVLRRAPARRTFVCARRKTVCAGASAEGSSKDAVNVPLRDGLTVATTAARAMSAHVDDARSTTGCAGFASGRVTTPLSRSVRPDAVIDVVYIRRANFTAWLRVPPTEAT